MLRNSLKIRPLPVVLPNDKYNYSLSDAFCWRSDNDFITDFRYTDLFNYFVNQSSDLKIVICSHMNKILKTITINPSELTGRFIISKEHTANITSGHFYVFHKIDKTLNHSISVRNSCYTGYSYKNNNFSLVHGNLPVCGRTVKDEAQLGNIIKSSWLRNYEYFVQNDFSIYDKIETFIFNPTNTKINLYVNNEKVTLTSLSSILFTPTSTQLISIKSKCLLMRPILFGYKGKFLDVFHG